MDEPEDHVFLAIRAALIAHEATQYAMRAKGVASATAKRIVQGKSPVHSDALSKALDAYGLTIKVIRKPKR
jgi:hypothetical protein